jgi:hypothetical protein
MSVAVPVAIPRWQWRTSASDLSQLFSRFPASVDDAGKAVEEIHLVCLHSSHSAVITGETLELRWRKELSPAGLELWDSILRIGLPYRSDDLARLWAAWGMPAPSPRVDYRSVASFLDDAIRPNREVLPVRVVRYRRDVFFHGMICSIERVEVTPPAHFDTFAIEHEDPSLMLQVLTDLGLDARDNVNFLRGLRDALGLPAPGARNYSWPKRSNASTS